MEMYIRCDNDTDNINLTNYSKIIFYIKYQFIYYLVYNE